MSKRKLLLADDSITIQKVVNLTFADEGIEVITVSDGDSAMEKLNEFLPDLVMADVNMPGLNGYQICEVIKQDKAIQHTPVILLVGSFEPFDEEEANRVGADAFLTKPFQSIRQLVNKVTELLNSSNKSASAASSGSVSESSFTDTLEMPKPVQNSPVEYDDSEFDDEMIQTNQVNSFALDDVQKFETKEVADSKEPDNDESEQISTDEVKDFAFGEMKEFGDKPIHQDTDAFTEPEPADEEVDDFSDKSEPIYVPETIEKSEHESESEAAVIEETSVEETKDLPTIEEPASSAGLNYEPADSESSEVEDNSQSEVNSQITQAKIEDIPLPLSASILDLDDDFLELPPIEGEETEEEITENEPVQQQQETPTHNLAEEPEIKRTTQEFANKTEEDTDANVSAVEPENNADIANTAQFSSELIDAVVQKVIEKLADKVIRDIAWEVVPQQADLIIRKMVEEKLKE